MGIHQYAVSERLIGSMLNNNLGVLGEYISKIYLKPNTGQDTIFSKT